jgi:hypothetical protein
MADVSHAEALLLEILGLKFLAYILNTDEAAISARLQAGQQLAPPQEAALGELVAFLGTLSSSTDAQPSALRSLALGVLGEFREELGYSWARAARVSLGGRDDLPKAEGALQSPLTAIAADVFPLCLLPRVDDQHFGFLSGPPLSTAVFGHPQSKVFEDAVMKDETLKLLFPEENEQSGRYGTVHRSTGSGGGIQLSMLASGLLESAWQALDQGDASPDAGPYARCALDQLDAIRRAIQGKRLTVRARVGITGLRLPKGDTLTLPWGLLREVNERDRYMVPPGLSGQLSHTTEDGKHVVIDYAGDLVVEMDVPYKIKLGPADALSHWPTELVSQEAVEERLETLRLALILCTTRRTPPIALGTWSVFVDPLAIGGRSSAWRDPRKGRSFAPVLLSSAEARRWGEWIQLVDERRTKNINVAIRRTLFAAADRVDPTDALVDAVIAWENLVGSSQGEPTLRIAAALAWLLGKNGRERQEIRRTIAALYKIRSDVVHGNRFLNPQEANDKHQEALDIAVRSLRVVIRNRPELLSDCKDSTERSLRLILNERDQTGPSPSS